MSTAVIVILVLLAILLFAGTVISALVASGEIDKTSTTTLRKRMLYAAIALGIATLVAVIALFAVVYSSHKK